MNMTPSSSIYSASTTTSDRPSSDQNRPRIDATHLVPVEGERALVLHGGGSAGHAWEIGIIAGLCEAGLDVTQADLIIGTSAGATVAAQITSTKPAELLAAIIGASQTRTNSAGPDQGRGALGPSANHMEVTSSIIASAMNPEDMRRKMGAAALEMDATSDDSNQRHWRATVAARLSSHYWPDQLVLITAVNAHTGEPVVFDRHSGIDLVDAVAASTSNGFGVPPYAIGDTRYIDGGYRRNENADLAVGYERVLVLSPFGGRTRHPLEWGMQLSAQVDELRTSGSRVESIFPDSDALVAFGTNMMDLSTRLPAAQAGCIQGKTLGQRLKEFWR
jgi:NTE family protein